VVRGDSGRSPPDLNNRRGEWSRRQRRTSICKDKAFVGEVLREMSRQNRRQLTGLAVGISVDRPLTREETLVDPEEAKWDDA